MSYEFDTLLIASDGYLGDSLYNIAGGLIPIEIVIEVPTNSTVELRTDESGKAPIQCEMLWAWIAKSQLKTKAAS